MGATILITGATGFLGKVVLAELMRRREALGVDRCILLIRGKRKQSAAQRFEQSLAPSPCFNRLPLGWTQFVDVVEGELSEPQCGIDDLNWRRIRKSVTQIIHCAASVDFDRPLAEARAANIDSTLNLLALAQSMPALRAFISTSTAYVTPHREGLIPEALAPLPRPAQAIMDDVRAGIDERVLLAETGHANTYTYTKCLAEHLLVQHRGHVPVTIVRPSIISASHLHPQPGWIDSKAAFAGFVVTIGTGLLRVVDADPTVRLDIVPVDHVAAVLIDEAMATAADEREPGAPSRIVHAVAGGAHAAHIGATSAAIVRFFRRHRVARRPKLSHLGERNTRYYTRELMEHTLPMWAARTVCELKRDARGAKRVQRISQTLKTINHVFPYFTQHTFDFATSRPLPKSFQIHRYVETVCRGALTHLMRKDRTQVPIGGRRFGSALTDLPWSLRQRTAAQGGTYRVAAAAARALFRRIFESVTFDEAALEQALLAVPKGAQVVLVPTHRSYLDSVLCSYLFYCRPDLGLPQPHVAAAADVAAKPGWSALLSRLRTVAVPRAHAPGAEAERMLAQALETSGPLQIFMEGERSRGRHVLAPRLDVIEAMRRTGRTFALIPIGISYERIAEETPFLRELRASRRLPLRPSQLWHWARRAWRGHIQLGRVHLSARPPLVVDGNVDATSVAQKLSIALRRSTVCTDFHLRAFLRRNPQAHIDHATLRAAIAARGGRVLRSGLPTMRPIELDAGLETTLRQQWQYLFAHDLLARYPSCQALARALGHLELAPPRAKKAEPGALAGLLDALARPISEDALTLCGALRAARGTLSPEGMAVEPWLATLPLNDRALAHPMLEALAEAKLVRLSAHNERIEALGGTEAAWRKFAEGCTLEAVQGPAVAKRRRRAP